MHKSKLMLLLVIFCLFNPITAAAKLKVVATLPTLGALAEEIGGDLVAVKILASSYEDPHFVDPRPNYVLALSKADILIYNGMELEVGWLPPVQKNSRNNKVLAGGIGAIDASVAITPQGVPSGNVDRSQGDVHSQGNPHYLYSLPEAMKVAELLAKKFMVIDPENGSYYQDRLNSFLKRAAERNIFWQQKFKTMSVEQRQVVSYHDSLIYLNKWLGLEQMATIEPLPGVAPGPAQIKNLVLQLKRQPVKYILQENYQPKNTSVKVAQMVGAKIVIIDPGPVNGEKYLDYVDRLLKQFF